VKVLIAEDDPVSRRLLRTTLTKWGHEVTVCADGVQALRALQATDAPRLAILDWMMPEMDGVQVCRELRKRDEEPYIYILLLTAKSQREDLVEGMNAGADDYLTKPFDPHELRVRMRSGMRILDYQAQLIEARERLRRQATHDPLTGLWNHSAILEILRHEVSRSKRQHTPLTVIMFDIDHFKQINDANGHVSGDAILHGVALRMREVIRDYDTLGRYGGDEFLIVLPDCNEKDAVEAAERLRKRIAGEPMAAPGKPISVTVSIGLATNEKHGDMDAAILVQAADVALYRAKNSGRNCTRPATADDILAETLLRTPTTTYADN